jgi:hypothetical protein
MALEAQWWLRESAAWTVGFMDKAVIALFHERRVGDVGSLQCSEQAEQEDYEMEERLAGVERLVRAAMLL